LPNPPCEEGIFIIFIGIRIFGDYKNLFN